MPSQFCGTAAITRCHSHTLVISRVTDSAACLLLMITGRIRNALKGPNLAVLRLRPRTSWVTSPNTVMLNSAGGEAALHSFHGLINALTPSDLSSAESSYLPVVAHWLQTEMVTDHRSSRACAVRTPFAPCLSRRGGSIAKTDGLMQIRVGFLDSRWPPLIVLRRWFDTCASPSRSRLKHCSRKRPRKFHKAVPPWATRSM